MRECLSTPWMSFTVPFFCASVAIVRRRGPNQSSSELHSTGLQDPPQTRPKSKHSFVCSQSISLSTFSIKESSRLDCYDDVKRRSKLAEGVSLRVFTK